MYMQVNLKPIGVTNVTLIKVQDSTACLYYVLSEAEASVCDLFRVASDYPGTSERQPMLQETRDITLSKKYINCIDYVATGPQPLPKHFSKQFDLLRPFSYSRFFFPLKSFSSCLRLPPRLLVPCIFISIFLQKHVSEGKSYDVHDQFNLSFFV